MMERLQKFWREGGFIVGVVAVALAWFDMKATAGEAKSIMEQQTSINAKLTAIVTANSTKLEVYFEIMGFDDEQAREWAKMPRSMPVDTLGQPVEFEPWLEVSEDLEVGVRFMVDDSANVLMDTLWNLKDKKK